MIAQKETMRYEIIYNKENTPEEGDSRETQQMLQLTVDEDNDDIKELSEIAAEDYFANHDGWEDSWPVVISVFDSAGTCLGTFKVELEQSLDFSARRV